MALFTSQADADLPLMSTFYQLEVDSLRKEFVGSELDYWLARWARWKWGIDFRSYSEMLINEGLAVPSMGDEKIRDLVNFHPLICGVMDNFADAKVIDQERLTQVNGILKTYLAAPSIRQDKESGNYIVAWIHPLDPTTDILKEMIYTLERERQGKIKLFARCAECHCAFLGAKPEQKFCSHRCAHREGSRRRYLRKPGKEFSDTEN